MNESIKITRKPKLNIKKYFLYLIVLVVLILPKFNIISIPGSRTGIRLEDVLLGIYFVILIRDIYKKKFVFNKILKKIFHLFLVFISISIISAIINSIRGNVSLVLSLINVFRRFEYFLFIFIGYELYNEKNGKNSLFRIINFSLVFHIIYMFLEYFGIIGDIGYLIGRPDNDRIYTTFSGPYEFSAFFSMMTCFNFYRLIKTKDGKYILSIIFMMIGIVISQSRISLLAVIITCMIILFYNLRKGKVFFLTSGIMLLLIPIFINITNLEAFNRFKDIDISSTFNTISIAWEEADFEFYHKMSTSMFEIISKYTPDIEITAG